MFFASFCYYRLFRLLGMGSGVASSAYSEERRLVKRNGLKQNGERNGR